jgi:hypothetical protein
MAQLSSPGVSVTVVDESFYTPAAPGTVPLIIVASQQDKMNSAGTGTAVGTLKANAGKVYLLTSQMDLGTTFGIPYFQTDASNNPVHAGELNEYGLQAAYSFLGVSNRAYVVRADLNTKQLIGTALAPTSPPSDGTLWFDTTDTAYGVFEWSAASATTTGGQAFSVQSVTVITDTALTTADSDTGDLAGYKPLPSVGNVGDYALVAVTTLNKLWMKKYLTDTAAGTWVEVGTGAWAASWPTVTGTVSTPTLSSTGVSFTAYIPQNTTRLSVISAVTGSAGIQIGDVISGTNVKASPTGTRIISVINSTFTGFISNGTSGSAGTVLTQLTGTTPVIGLVLSGGTTTAYTYITAVNTATFTGTITGTALTVSSVTGTITTGMLLSGGTIGAGVYIVSGSGTSWVVSASQTGGTTTTTGTNYTVSTSQAVGTAGSPTSFTGQAYNVDDAPTAGTVNGTVTTGGDTLTINSTLITGVTFANLATQINDAGITGVTAAQINGYLNIYSTGVDVAISGTIATACGITAGTYGAPKLTLAPHTSIPLYKITDTSGTYISGRPTGSLWVKTTPVNQGADWIIKKYSSLTGSWIEQPVQLFSNAASALATLDPKGGGANLAVGQVYVKYNDDETSAQPYANFKIYGRSGVGSTLIVSNSFTTSSPADNNYAFTMSWTTTGSSSYTSAVTVSFSLAIGSQATATARAQLVVAAINSAVNGDSNVTCTINSDNSINIIHTTGGDIKFVDGSNTPLATLFTAGTTTNYYVNPTGTGTVATLWSPTSAGTAVAPASATAPTTIPADGTLWYNTDVSDIDIMVHNGTTWVGYLNYVQNGAGGTTTDPAGPIVSATKPTVQSDGTPLANGDLWISTADIDNFPHIYKYDYLNKKWVLLDNTDQTTENGVLFHDARWTVDGTGTGPSTIKALLSSNFLDPDAPDPALYPKGMLLWNLRRSGNNVVKFEQGYIDVTARNPRMSNALQSTYYPHRWVSQAANQLDGSGTFGRKSQRAVVLTALEELINSNQQIRDEDSRQFNLLACPGYLEALSTLIDLNTSRGETAFIVADTPARLAPDATTLSNWGSNVAKAAVDGETGLIATNSYAAVYYPWGYTTDLHGNNIVVPPSHIMLRTIALSDNVSYPWFAPAGVRRGGVTNASSVGYVDATTGEFVTVALNTGQRDTLAGVHVNPITYIAGTGLVCYGQKTRQLIASSLDRINVARLVIYLRYQLNQIAKPFVFEPNDTITRNEIKQQIEKLLLELTGQRALYDYIVVCDGSNNTPARIDANELHVDIAIEPVKAVEFIYIPMRLENTGAIKGL